MTRELILIVDDNEANLKVARVALESEGYAIRTAADGEQALAVLREIHPRLVLMDIQLPLIDGLELTRRIKADPATRDIVIVAVTAYAMKNDRETALAAGCDGYITKPLDPIALPQQIAQYLHRNGGSDIAAMPAEAKSQPLGVDANAPLILVVEDNASTRRLYSFALRGAGFNVIEAEDGARALARFDERRPALIVVDLVLPDIDGVDLMRRFRARLGDARLPILCISGFLSRLDELTVSEADFSQVLLKPVDPAVLIDIVHAHLTVQPNVPDSAIARTVLLVDDDPVQVKLMRLWLRNANLRVVTANDGETALAIARRERPALVVSDVLMPKIDGFSLCQALRTDAELGQTPVILVSSAYCEAADHALAARVGASALVTKIEGIEALIANIEKIGASAPLKPLQSAPIDREHLERTLWQLERQMQVNARLAQRALLTERLLAVLAKNAAAMMREEEAIGHVLNEALMASLDVAGVSKGALFLFGSDQRLTLACRFGFGKRDRDVENAFGFDAAFAQAARRAQPVSLPSADWPPDDARSLLVATGVTSLQLVPIAWGDTAHGLLLLGGRTADVTSDDALAFGHILGAELGKAIGLARYAFRLAASERRYRVLTEHANDAIALTTPDGTIREVNSRLVEIFGFPASELVGRKVASFAAEGSAAVNTAIYENVVSAGAGRTPPVELRRANGDTVLVEFSSAMVTIDGERMMLSIGRDVTEQVRTQQQLQFNLTHDQTTGLPRFELIDLHLRGMIAETAATAAGGRIGVLHVALDYLQALNETRGYEAGDHALHAIAKRLAGMAEDSAVARIAGDEFIVLHRCAGSSAELADFAESVRAAIAQPIDYEDQPIRITGSIGVSCFPDNSTTAKELLRQAESGLICAKKEGRNCVCVFSNGANEQMRNRLALGPQLRSAIREHRFVLEYQPQISSRDWKVTGFEALVRWQHPDRGLLPPDAFIRTAEDLGVIVELGSFVLAEACRQARAWLDAGAEPFTLAVNVSAQQLMHPEFVTEVATALAEHRLPRDSIELELTEASMLQKVEQVAEKMLELRKLGVRLTIDDFGTGFSSLNYLRSLPVDCLKIDRSFVRDIVSDVGAAGICVAIIALGHQLGIRVLAEGVETRAQVSYLKRNECDLLQGFYFCKPVSAGQAYILLQQRLVSQPRGDESEPRQTLLLVDDESNMLSALVRALRRDGYRILTANSGEKALETLACERVDVVVSDQRMPGMSGTELMSRIKELHPHTVRLVLSGYTEVDTITEAINRGAIYKFLTKPWNDEELRLQVRDAFRAQARLVKPAEVAAR